MDACVACVGKMVVFLADGAINYVKRQGASVIRYKNKVRLLKEEYKRLCEKKERIQGMVEEATNNGKVIETEVSSWLKDVEEMEIDIANFLHLQENRESFKCFAGCKCPNLMWRHKRGKEADKRKPNVIKLISKGDRLEKSPVAHEAPFQWEPQFDSSQYYTMFNSRALVFNKIMEALKDSGVDMIGIHGPGGAGKTTMVKEVAKEAKKVGIFDKIVIAVVSKDPDTSKLQEELAPQLDLKYEQRSDSGRADELRKALLNGKKILVILDDLWQVPYLDAIGIPISGPNHKGCKILLTSRREEVFKRMNVHSYFSIGYLEEQEAWELFTKVTGDFGVDESIARKVSKRCGGLPIAIVAVGAALKDEEEFEWHNALHKLKNSPLKYIEGIDPVGYNPLKWSYEFLKDEDAKSCFLLCCLFPEDDEIDINDLVRYSFALGFLRRVDTLKVARNIVQAMVKKLKKSCLLLNGAKENFVKMHDVIRDLAISITKEKQIEHGDSSHDWPGQQQFIVDHNIRKWPKNDAWEHHTAISLRINEGNICFPYGVLHCPLMHILVLDSREYSLKISNDFFQGMKEARVLDLKNICLELPSSVLGLDHLRMLRTYNCQLLGDLSTIRNLKNHIEMLTFHYSTIKALPREIGELTLLRSLDIRHCDLTVIPKGVISNLIHLEQLYVTGFNGWDITVDSGGMSNASIAELKSLTQLTVLYVSISVESSRIMAEECPDLLEKLINFGIVINSDSRYMCESWNALDIKNIHHINDEFCLLMNKVKELQLSNIQELRYPLDKLQLKFTASGGGFFSKLTCLTIFKCGSMKYLFSLSCVRAIQQLQELTVRDCNNMEQIIGVADHHHEKEVVTDETIIFSRLVKLSLGGLPQFRSFYRKMEKTTIERNLSNYTTITEFIFDEKVCFPVLNYLWINALPVEDIWNKPAIQSRERSSEVSFSQLQTVYVAKCDNLVNMFPSNMRPRLQKLGELNVHDCPSLTLLVEDLNPNIQSPTVKSKFNTVFPNLKDLILYNLPKLMRTCLIDEGYCSYVDSVDLYLKNITIIGCGSLRHAFSAFVARHLPHIQCLHIKACSGMEVIVLGAKGEGETDDGVIKFNELKELQLDDLPNFRSFYESKSEALHLFNYQDACPNIENLTLRGFKSIRKIQLWDLITTEEHRHNVTLRRCHVSTKVLSHHVKRGFRMIHLQDCHGFKHVVDLDSTISVGKEQFLDVERLKLYGLPELVSLWNKNFHEIWDFQSLKYINIKNCSQMKSLLTHSMATTLQHLEKLLVQSCEMMEEIIILEENKINIVREEKATWQIEFPKLEYLILIDLPNLKSYCNDERGSFSFSSLRGVCVRDCPKMKTFVSGQICLLPRMMRVIEEDKAVEITNLNAYFEARNDGSNNAKKIIRWGDGFNYNELFGTGEYFDDASEILYACIWEYESEYYNDD